MGCKGCGKKSNNASPTAPLRSSSQQSLIAAKTMADDDFVMVEYNHPNKGQHGVYGAGARNADKMFYGYRKSGDRFLVKRSDQQAYPHYFHLLPDKGPAPSSKPTPSLPPAPTMIDSPPPPSPPVDKGEKKTVLESVSFDLQALPGITPAVEKGLRSRGLTTPTAILEAGEEGLTEIKHIGDTRAKIILAYLEEHYA